MSCPAKPLLRETGDLKLYGAAHQRVVEDYRLALSEIRKCFANDRKVSVLVIGPGDGRYDADIISDNLAPLCRVTLIEPSKDAVDACKNIAKDWIVVNDTFDTWARGNEEKYDVVIAFSVLHHLPNWRDSVSCIVATHLTIDGILISDEWLSGNPLYNVDLNSDLNTPADIRRVFLMRESMSGVFWDPELRGHRSTPLISWMCRFGFDCNVIDPAPNVTDVPWSFNFKAALLDGTSLAITRWGCGVRLREIVKSFKKIFDKCGMIDGSVARCRFFCFRRSSGVAMNPCAGDDEWAVAKIHHHLSVELQNRSASSHAERRLLQAMQLLVQYGVVCADTIWCVPIRARVHSETLQLLPDTEPIHCFLVQDTESASPAVGRMLLNMYRLINVVKLKSGSITSEVLGMLDSDPGAAKYKDSHIRVTAKTGGEAKMQLKLEPHHLHNVFKLEVPLSGDVFTSLAVEKATDYALKMIGNESQFRFGEFCSVDLKKCYDKFISEIPIDTIMAPNTGGENTQSQTSPTEVLAQFGPMMAEDEVLHVVFSPYSVSVSAQSVKDNVIGGFLILEKRRDAAWMNTIDDLRFARLRVISRLLQSEVAEFIHVRARELAGKAEEKSVEWQREANLQKRIKSDLDLLLKGASALSTVALRIEGSLGSSKVKFLELNDTLGDIFEPDRTFYYGSNDQGVFCISATAAGSLKKFITIHSSVNPGKERSMESAWDDYAKLLIMASGKSGYDEPWLYLLAKEGAVKDAPQVAFNFLKLILNRPQKNPTFIYDVQIAFCVRHATSEWLSTVEIFDENKKSYPFTVKDGVADCAPWLQSIKNTAAPSGYQLCAENKENAILLTGDVSTQDVLLSLMRLCEELKPGMGAVSLFAAKIIIARSNISVYLNCNGVIPSESLRVDELSAGHGLRSCIKTLCSATGQKQVKICKGEEEASQANGKTCFCAFSGLNQTKFLLMFSRSVVFTANPKQDSQE
jgi:SAM-dependent methyltransferase